MERQSISISFDDLESTMSPLENAGPAQCPPLSPFLFIFFNSNLVNQLVAARPHLSTSTSGGVRKSQPRKTSGNPGRDSPNRTMGHTNRFMLRRGGNRAQPLHLEKTAERIYLTRLVRPDRSLTHSMAQQPLCSQDERSPQAQPGTWLGFGEPTPHHRHRAQLRSLRKGR
jgi:hypothetical protein